MRLADRFARIVAADADTFIVGTLRPILAEVLATATSNLPTLEGLDLADAPSGYRAPDPVSSSYKAMEAAAERYTRLRQVNVATAALAGLPNVNAEAEVRDYAAQVPWTVIQGLGRRRVRWPTTEPARLAHLLCHGATLWLPTLAEAKAAIAGLREADAEAMAKQARGEPVPGHRRIPAFPLVG